jgi:hypothetical protein
VKTGVVAFIDVLGVKGLWARIDPKEFMKSWKSVLRLFSVSRKAISKEYQYSVQQTSIRAFSEVDPIDYFLFMCDLLIFPFFHALDKGIYLRGVISIGRFEISKTIILGPAIDEAAEWYTKYDWFGISLTPAASYGLQKLIDKGFDQSKISKIFVKYNIPMKSEIDAIKSFTLNWPYGLVSFLISHGEKESFGRSMILERFSKSQIGVETYRKYKNTLAFWDYVMDDKNKDLLQ